MSQRNSKAINYKEHWNASGGKQISERLLGIVQHCGNINAQKSQQNYIEIKHMNVSIIMFLATTNVTH